MSRSKPQDRADPFQYGSEQSGWRCGHITRVPGDIIDAYGLIRQNRSVRDYSRHGPSEDFTPHGWTPVYCLGAIIRRALGEQRRQRKLFGADHQVIALRLNIHLAAFLQADLCQHRLGQPNADAIAPFLEGDRHAGLLTSSPICIV